MISKNWMTTVAGIVSGCASLILFLHLGGFVVFPHWVMGLVAFIQAGGTMSLGIVAKQYNMTGGTVGQPSTAQALLDSNTQPAAGVNKPELVK
jgi:hypothetical protein